MAIQVKVGKVAFVSGNTTNIVVTGVGFTPQVVIIWCAGQTGTANVTGAKDRVGSIGWAINPSVGNGRTSNDAATGKAIGVTDNRNTISNTQIIDLGTAAGLGGPWGISAYSADGFTLHWLNTGASPNDSYEAHYMCIAGLPSVVAGQFTQAVVAGNQSVTGLAFQPDLVLAIAAGGGGWGIGIADALGNMASMADIVQGDNNVGDNLTSDNTYSRTAKFISTFNFPFTRPATLDSEGTLVSMDVAGFTINWSTLVLGGLTVNYLAFGGSRGQVGTFSTKTDGSSISLPVSNCTPRGALLFSNCKPQSASLTADADDTITVGAYDGTTQGVHASRAQDGVGTTNVVTSLQVDGAYANPKADGSLQGKMVFDSMSGSGFAAHMSTPDPVANLVAFMTFGDAPPTNTNKTHNIDADISPAQPVKSHAIDADLILTVPPTNSKAHSIDLYVQPGGRTFLQEGTNLIPPITDPNAFVKQAVNLSQPVLDFIQEAVTLQALQRSFLNEGPNLVQQNHSYLKSLVTLSKGAALTHSIDANLAVQNRSFLQTGVTLIQKMVPTGCDGSYPDISFLKSQVWLVSPGTASKQAPGTTLTTTDDWASQTDAMGAYQQIGRFVLAGIPLVITGFTSGVVSWQTRTRQWLRLVDYEPGGVVISENTKTQKLANGQTIQTNTKITQVQDTTITAVTVIDSTNPNRVTKSVTERTQGGSTVTRDIQIISINGVRTTTEKKNVAAEAAPSVENIQPIKVTTLDGVIHYQFFGTANTPAWAGGEAEGLSDTVTEVTVSGNTRHTVQTTSTPDGKIIQIATDETGLRDTGQTITDTAEQYNGIQKTTVRTVTYPDGSQEVTTNIVNSITGDTTETLVETATDENGLQTVTTTNTETQTFQDPVTSNIRTMITKTVTVAGPNGTFTDTTTEFRDNFEDDLLQQKIKVYLIQEFTVNCIIDRFSKEALEEIAIGHQKNFAVAELIGQQLGNMDLSWLLRNNLIGQFNEAINCISPVQFQALGKTYKVVFAPSASSFRAKYVVGTLPAIYELQMIIQERSDLVTGLAGF